MMRETMKSALKRSFTPNPSNQHDEILVKQGEPLYIERVSHASNMIKRIKYLQIIENQIYS